MKKSYSISTIFSAIILLIFLLLVLPISYFSFQSFENSLNENRANYVKQIENNMLVLLEQELTILDNLTLELSTLIGNLKNDDFANHTMDSDREFNEIDLYFVKRGKEVVNHSTSLYDTDSMIDRLLEVYNNSERCLYKVTIEDETFAIILRSKKIINASSGRVEGEVFVGKVFNDNFSLLKFFQDKATIMGLSFGVNQKLVSSSYQKEHEAFKMSQSLINSPQSSTFLQNESILVSKFELTCKEEHSGIYALPVLDGKEFIELKKGFNKQIVILIALFVLIGFVSILLVNRFVINPMQGLLNFAKEVTSNDKKRYHRTTIQEFNILGKGLEDIISQLRDVKEQYSLAVDGTQEGLWDWCISTNTIYFSNRCKEIIGFKPDEIQLDIQSWQERIPSEDKKRIDKVLIAHFKKEIPYFEGEFRIQCKDGSYKWLKVRAKALFDENDKAYRMVGFYTDIDPIKKLEEENRQKEAYILEQSKMTAMGDMLSNIAHQWRQPLSVVTTIVSGIKVTLELDLFDKDDIIRDLDTVSKTSENMSKTIDTFRQNYSFGHQKEDFNLKDIVEKDIELLKPAFTYENIEFVLELENIEYYGYRDEFLLIMNKLLQNSKEAIKNHHVKSGMIFIELKQLSNIVSFKVRDNGLGIEESIQEKIFEPYFTTKHQAQGVGLSLYVAKNLLMKYFEGTLTFENKAYGFKDESYQGAEFTVKFPLK